MNENEELIEQFSNRFVNEEDTQDLFSQLVDLYSSPDDFQYGWKQFLYKNSKDLDKAKSFLSHLQYNIIQILKNRSKGSVIDSKWKQLKGLNTLLKRIGFHKTGEYDDSVCDGDQTRPNLKEVFCELYVFIAMHVYEFKCKSESEFESESSEEYVDASPHPPIPADAKCYVCASGANICCPDCNDYYCDKCVDDFHRVYPPHNWWRQQDPKPKTSTLVLKKTKKTTTKSPETPSKRNSLPTVQTKPSPSSSTGLRHQLSTGDNVFISPKRPPRTVDLRKVSTPSSPKSSDDTIIDTAIKLLSQGNPFKYSFKALIFILHYLPNKDAAINMEQAEKWLCDLVLSFKNMNANSVCHLNKEDLLLLIESLPMKKLLNLDKKGLLSKLLIEYQQQKECIMHYLPDYTTGEVTNVLATHRMKKDQIFSHFNKMIMKPYQLKDPEPFNSSSIWDIAHKLSLNNYNVALTLVMAELPFPYSKAAQLCLELLQNEHIREILGTDRLTYNSFLLVVLNSFENYSKEHAEHQILQKCIICFEMCCKLCMDDLMTCTCEMCRVCFQKHFDDIIRNKAPPSWGCPVCGNPDMNGVYALGDPNIIARKETELEDHLNNLNWFVENRYHLKELCSLFRTKSTAWRLSKESNFLWCAHGCGNGMIYDGVNSCVFCQVCNRYTCKLCKKMWEKEHEDKTCEEFEAWKIMQDPHIAKLIQLTGIECPKCHMNYQLVRGGCLHFTCHQCKFEFCGGCSQPIYIKDVCPMGCEGLGLHAHHPRDCLYFLRDWNVETLEKLLTNHEVKLEAENEIPVEEENPKQCNVILAESLDGEEKQCGKPYFKSDLCEIHYKEYLIHLINKNKLDPATLMDINSMELCLKRMRCPLLTRTSTEDDAAYQPRILAYLQQQLPIIAAATVQQDENNQQEGDAEPAEVADA